MTVKNTDKATQIGLLISYYITLSFWSAQTLSPSLISRNIAGQTKKSTVVATNFVSWAVGNAIGKLRKKIFNERQLTKYFQAPKYSSNGTHLVTSSLSLSISSATVFLCLLSFTYASIFGAKIARRMSWLKLVFRRRTIINMFMLLRIWRIGRTPTSAMSSRLI
jgi:hypothetical protein